MDAVLPNDAGHGVESLAALKTLLIMQTRKGCLQEMMGCDATSEFNIATKEAPNDIKYYAIEQSSFCIRLCCKASRPLTMTVHVGTSAAGPVLLKMDRPFRCPLGQCKCCCGQEMRVANAGGQPLGKAVEGFYVCPTPFFQIKDASGATQYEVQQPTCCFGSCVNVCAEGCCNCKIPFYVYPPGNREDPGVGKVIKEWGGLATEMFSSADKFSVEFPPDASPEVKAAIWGAVMLVDYNFFEGGKESPTIGAPPSAEAMDRE